MSSLNGRPASDRLPAAVAHVALQLNRSLRKVLVRPVVPCYSAGRWELEANVEGDQSARLGLHFHRWSGKWQMCYKIGLTVDGQPVDVGDDLTRALAILNGGQVAEDTSRRTRTRTSAQGGLDSVGVRRHSVIRT